MGKKLKKRYLSFPPRPNKKFRAACVSADSPLLISFILPLSLQKLRQRSGRISVLRILADTVGTELIGLGADRLRSGDHNAGGSIKVIPIAVYLEPAGMH